MNIATLLQLLITLGPKAVELLKQMIPMIKEIIDIFKQKNPTPLPAFATVGLESLDDCCEDQKGQVVAALQGAGCTMTEAEDIFKTLNEFENVQAVMAAQQQTENDAESG